MKTSLRIISILISFLSILNVSAQSTNFEWAVQIAGTDNQWGRSITVDEMGNVYSSGRFTETVDFDPGVGVFNLTSIGVYDGYILKLDSNGTFLWANQIAGIQHESGESITIDADGNVLTTGFFTYTVDFDPGPDLLEITAVNALDVFIQKLDPDGNLIWVKTFGGEGFDMGGSITTDLNGNVYTTGQFDETVDFDPNEGIFNLTAVYFHDVFIQKLDVNGNFLWAKSMGGESFDEGLSITTDFEGNVITSGSFTEEVDFDPGPGITNIISNGSSDNFIQKLDANGNFLWVYQVGGSSAEFGSYIATDAFGNIYSTDQFSGTVDFNPTGPGGSLYSIGDPDSYVLKIDMNGDYLWVKHLKGTSLVDALGIATDVYSNVYTTGYFVWTADFDPSGGYLNYTSNGAHDIFIQKMDPDGNLLFAKQMGGIGHDRGFSIFIEENGNILTLGNFSGAVDFDPGTNVSELTSDGNFVMFIQKLSQCPPLPEFIVSKTGDGLTAVLSEGTTYQWLDCNDEMSIIEGETSNVFVSETSGSFALQVTTENCIETSPCFDIIIAGLDENTFDEFVTLYPNPNEGDFSIEFENVQEFLTVNILSIYGQRIETNKFNNTDLVLIKITQPNGIYLAEIVNNDGAKATFQIIKK